MAGAVDAPAAGDEMDGERHRADGKEMDGGRYRADGELEALLVTLASETAAGMDAPATINTPAPMPTPMPTPMVAPMAEPAAAASLEEVRSRHHLPLAATSPSDHLLLISPYISLHLTISPNLLKRPPISRHLPERTLTLSLIPALTP